MTLAASLQPDQQPDLWSNHVAAYEAVFEPLSNAFARRALDRLNLAPGASLLDVAGGAGGAALIAAARGIDVVAIDASSGMVSRIRQRAAEASLVSRLRAEVMDGQKLLFPPASFDGAISTFGIILFPDAVAAIREIARALKPGGRVAVVAWTEPGRYEVASRLIDAIAAVRGPQAPPASLPAQLRFREEASLRALLGTESLQVDEIDRIEERLHARSARWLAERLEFAPGMAAWLNSLGPDRERVLEAFVEALERDQGTGEVALLAVAFVGIARRGH